MGKTYFGKGLVMGYADYKHSLVLVETSKQVPDFSRPYGHKGTVFMNTDTRYKNVYCAAMT